MQNESGAKIRIAPNGQFFPGTQRRTLMLQVICADLAGIDTLLPEIVNFWLLFALLDAQELVKVLYESRMRLVCEGQYKILEKVKDNLQLFV